METSVTPPEGGHVQVEHHIEGGSNRLLFLGEGMCRLSICLSGGGGRLLLVLWVGRCKRKSEKVGVGWGCGVDTTCFARGVEEGTSYGGA